LAALYAVSIDDAQLIAAALLLFTDPSETTYAPLMFVPGETPIDPTATVLRAPLKAISVPAMMAKVAQFAVSIADAAFAVPLGPRLLSSTRMTEERMQDRWNILLDF
jgi:hypothetical protein